MLCTIYAWSKVKEGWIINNLPIRLEFLQAKTLYFAVKNLELREVNIIYKNTYKYT
jgi:hypothetical protein